jgi:cell division protein FtsW
MAKGKKKKFGFFINGKFDYILLIVTLLLLSIGLIILLSASAPTSLSESGNSYQYVVKQGMVAVAGLALMIILSRIDYRIYRKLKWFFYIGLVVLLFAVGFVGTAAGGARRWINIFGFSFQPSEFAKVFFVLFYASLLSDLKEKEKIKKLVPGFIFPLLFLVPIVIAVYGLQNHFSATFIICAITMIQMFVAGTRLTYFFGAAGLGGAGGALYIIKKMASSSSDGSSGFRLDRIQTWLNPDSDFTGKGWQINQSLYAIGSGGLFGVGLGNSKQKYLYLPEPQNDFIFAVLAEELGFFGCSIVILLFLLFVWRGIVISIKAQDNFGTLIGIGLTTMIGLQALVNIAVVTNTIPVTGMP